MSNASDLFEYTSGRWIYNDYLRHLERRRVFNVSELKRLAALAVQQKEDDITRFEKLAEGGFNRTFLITMRDGFQFVARIPYPHTEPKFLVVSSEVATMGFLHAHGIPVPKVFGYATDADNSAGTEYIFMEFVQGTNLGDVWYDLSEQERIKMVGKLVELEARLFELQFPASGSLYYCDDLPEKYRQIITPNLSSTRRFCVGPDTSLALWYGKGINLPVERGPYQEPLAVLIAGATKEIAYLEKFGRALQPLQRLCREEYNYKAQSHVEHIIALKKYLGIAPHLLPQGCSTLQRPTLRHPDLQPNNVFISDDMEIKGIIDWQHAAILPLFLQCAIPGSLQNYGDDISELLQVPILPRDFDKLEDMEKFQKSNYRANANFIISTSR